MRRHLGNRPGPTVALALALGLTACGTADDAASPSGQSASTTTPSVSSPSSPSTPSTPTVPPTFDVGSTPEDAMSPSLAAVVEAASRDVRTRTRTVGDVRVVSAEEGPVRQDTLDWCAARGTVVEDASFRVVVGVDERVWLYLAGQDGEPVLCPTDEPDQGTEFLPPPGFDD